ncbi:MAG: DNA mismatch repair protein MutS [Ktedonobacteraceae bacterium]|nr:DNA mismatch repair protein MutS [Ktedonobacteraceae bacterium]
MKVFLMHHDRDFDLQQPLPANAQELTQDLELHTLFNAMALGDTFLFDVAKKAVLTGLQNDLETIRYRQQILQDCLNNAGVVREIYALAVEAIEGEKRNYLGLLSKYPDALLRRSIEVLQMFVSILKKLKRIAELHAPAFTSAGFRTFFAMLNKELDETYFTSIQQHLRRLKFPDGVLISAGLGQGNKGIDYVLRRVPDKKQNWLERLFAEKPSTYTFFISDRDESGARALSELRDRGIHLVANALAQSADHVLSFFTMLRIELAFYTGCLNLSAQLAQKEEPLSFPQPLPAGERRQTFTGLYDVCLALTMRQRVVGNSVHADGKELVIITGANQGGKSTFLRSIGLAQLMMQCGMFVPAVSFSAHICTGIFTHYKREEDETMKSGKLDEELSRMSNIVDHIKPDALVLFNESFAATNEREGSEIARQIVLALLEKHIKVFFVTHLYEFAHGFYVRRLANALFLRAERLPDGRRTFQLIEGEPMQTSYGADLYQQIFCTAAAST